MFGKTSQLNPLELRKQMLVAESELNRAQMLHDLVMLTAEVHALARRAKSIASVASSAAVLVAGLTAWPQSQPAKSGAKPTWWQNILQGVRLISTFWSAFCPPAPDSTDR